VSDEGAAGERAAAGEQGAARPTRVRRQRSATESLLSIALGLEALVLFFATLTVRGLNPTLDPGLVLGGGFAFILVLAVVAGQQRRSWGVALGAALQVAIIATGILVPAMYLIGVGFAALWAWCLWRGRKLDRARQQAAEGGTA